MRDKPSIEPDDGYNVDDELLKTWDDWEREREEYLNRTWPGLFNSEVLKCTK